MSLRHHAKILLGKFERDFATYNRIEVSSEDLLHNADLFRGLSGLDVIPVLKSNAYGHGLSIVTEALKSAQFPYIAVDGYFEALRIREISHQAVLVMGAIMPENFARMKYDKFTFVVHDDATVRALGETGKMVKVHIEINTGMNRHGVTLKQLNDFVRLVMQFPNLELEGIMSHLADSDGDDPATVDEAVKKFDEAVEAVRAAGARPSIIHVAQSAGSLKAHSKYANAMRLGIGLYGINPFPPRHPLHKQLKDLQPALRLISTITKVHELEKGDKVSYNYTFTAPRPMRIGVLPLGYYEGVNRALSNVGIVKIGETYARITGRVCMNHTMISLDGTNAKVGDEVVVYSNKIIDRNAIDPLTAEHHLFNYDLLTALSADVRRTLVD